MTSLLRLCALGCLMESSAGGCKSAFHSALTYRCLPVQTEPVDKGISRLRACFVTLLGLLLLVKWLSAAPSQTITMTSTSMTTLHDRGYWACESSLCGQYVSLEPVTGGNSFRLVCGYLQNFVAKSLSFDGESGAQFHESNPTYHVDVSNSIHQ